jgi:beta-phosphoglucomutase-like phosphatase (HAD superfamily)
MDIAFDLDGTLVPGRPEMGDPPPWYVRPLTSERLRPGARDLLAELGRQHRIWLYTTSLRGTIYLRLWFHLLGIRLAGVVNGDVHRRIVGSQGTAISSLSKYPPAFGISVLVDDSPGVAEEGVRHGFAVVCVPDRNAGWIEAVRAGIERLSPPDA